MPTDVRFSAILSKTAICPLIRDDPYGLFKVSAAYPFYDVLDEGLKW